MSDKVFLHVKFDDRHCQVLTIAVEKQQAQTAIQVFLDYWNDKNPRGPGRAPCAHRILTDTGDLVLRVDQLSAIEYREYDHTRDGQRAMPMPQVGQVEGTQALGRQQSSLLG